MVAGSEVHASAFRKKCLARPAILFFMPDKKEEIKNYQDQEIKLKMGILLKLKNTFFAYYLPVYSPRDADFHYTTAMLYQKCLLLVPNSLLYSESDLVLWLHEAGFTWFDYGELNFEWMLKKA